VHHRLAYARDAALLAARLLLGTIMFAHGYQKLMIDGIGRTTQGFETMSIPVAILSASFVTVVEFVGGVLLAVGLVVPVVAALEGFVMVGAAAYVHLPHGIFVAEGGWELVGAIGAGLAALAAAGPGRFSVAHLLAATRATAPSAPSATSASGGSPFDAPHGPPRRLPEPVPPAGLPLLPRVRLEQPAHPVLPGGGPSPTPRSWSPPKR